MSVITLSGGLLSFDLTSGLLVGTNNQGNESRLTSEGAEDLEQVVRIPGGAFSPSLDG
jgi:hypothetical protein